MFEVAAAKANATKKVWSGVTWKSIQDRYKLLQNLFDSTGRREALMSGISREVGEMDEMLSSIREFRQDLVREVEDKK